MWQQLMKALEDLFKTKLRDLLVSLVAKAIGVASGFNIWLIKMGITIVWKKADKELESAARLADQKKVDEDLNKKYQEDIKNGKSEADLIKDESRLFNGGRNSP